MKNKINIKIGDIITAQEYRSLPEEYKANHYFKVIKLSKGDHHNNSISETLQNNESILCGETNKHYYFRYDTLVIRIRKPKVIKHEKYDIVKITKFDIDKLNKYLKDKNLNINYSFNNFHIANI